jgi:hypothetical protein
MRISLIIAAVAIALRTVLYYAGVRVEAMEFVPVHLLAMVLIAYLSGFLLLRKDPSRGMAELIRAGLRDTAVYALLIAVFAYLFFTYINPDEFVQRNTMMIDEFVKQGHPEAEARAKVERYYSPFSYATITFFGLLLLGVMNTLIFGALHHKVLRRFKR